MPITHRLVLASFALAFVFGGCASKQPALTAEQENSLACTQYKQMHEYALAAHVDYSGWTSEVASRAAERFISAIDPYSLFFADAESVALRSAALVADPAIAPGSCNLLTAAAALMGGLRDHLRTVVLEALVMPDPKGGVRSVTLPKSKHQKPEQRDAALTAAVRHQRSIFITAGLLPIDAAGATLLWFEEAFKRITTPRGILHEMTQAFLRSLPGENALLPDSLAHIEALGAEDPLVRAIRQDWLPEVSDLNEWGFSDHAKELHAGDRVVGLELGPNPEGKKVIHSWMGEGPTYAGHVLPLAVPSVLPFQLVVLRKATDGVYRAHRIAGGNSRTIFDEIPGEFPILVVRATQFEAALVGAIRNRIDSLHPRAVVLDLRGATAPTEFVTEYIAGVFLDNSVFGYLSFRKERLGDRKAVALTNAPPWSGPLVVVVGPNTRGPAESLAAGLQSTGRAVIVGSTRTAGQGGASFATDIHNGRNLLMTFATRFLPDGKSLEGVGILPDILVGPPAQRVIPRFGIGEPLKPAKYEASTWPKPAKRSLASLPTAELKTVALRAAKMSKPGEDRLGEAARAVALELARREKTK